MHLKEGDKLFLRESRGAMPAAGSVVGSKPWAKPRDADPSDRVVSAGLTCTVAEPLGAGLNPGGDVPRFHADKSGWRFSFGWNRWPSGRP